MKSKVISLTKVLLKNAFQKMQTETSSNKKRKPKSMLILYSICFLYLAGIMGFFSYQIIQNLIMIKQEQVFLGIILMGVAMFVMLQTIFSGISLLYYTKDNEYILPLPIKSSQIIMAKTNVLIITEYIMESIIGLIPLILYGILTGAGILYYITMTIILLVFPILPILLVSLLIMIIMSFAKLTKNRNRFQIIATIILIVVIFFFSTSIQKTEGTQEELIKLITQANGLVQMIEGYFPTLGMAINALTANNVLTTIGNISILILTTIAIYCIYVVLAQKLYFKGAVGNLSSGIKTKKKLNEKVAFKKSNLAKTYIGKEFKILLRNPVFLLQCILPAVLFPVLFIGISLLGANNSGDEEIKQMMRALNTIGNKESILIGAGVLGVLQFFSMFIYISVTAISREGRNAVFMKYIPVSLMKQLEYKIAPNIIMNIFTNLVTVILVQILLKLPISYLILIFISSIIIAVLQSYLMILVDLKKPKLEWSSEYAVVKQNINLAWPVVMSLANITIIIVISALSNLMAISGYITIGVIALLYLLAVIQVRKYIEKNQVRLFEKIF